MCVRLCCEADAYFCIDYKIALLHSVWHWPLHKLSNYSREPSGQAGATAHGAMIKRDSCDPGHGLYCKYTTYIGPKFQKNVQKLLPI